MKKFVEIQSSETIAVTCGLQNDNNEKMEKDKANKGLMHDTIKVSPLWPKASVLIKAGKAWYPSEIVEWNTVKALEKSDVLTIGRDTDVIDDAEMIAKKKEIRAALGLDIIDVEPIEVNTATKVEEPETKAMPKSNSLADLFSDN